MPMIGKSYLLLERYWPIFSWLFQSRRCKASTLPSLMKERLWFTASLVGQSDAISRKNLQKYKIIRILKTRYTHIYIWINLYKATLWSNWDYKYWGLIHTWLSLHEKRDNEKLGFLFLIPSYSFTVGSEVRQKQSLDGWGFGEKPVTYR